MRRPSLAEVVQLQRAAEECAEAARREPSPRDGWAIRVRDPAPRLRRGTRARESRLDDQGRRRSQ
jgi:hypothetical protein